MNKYLKISAIIAFLLGIASAVTGTLVILGMYTPGYPVLVWLVNYNIILGIVSIFSSVLIWLKKFPALQIAAIISTAHILVFLLLNTLYFDVTAQQSINAMAMRTFLWLAILYVLKRSKQY